MTGGYRVLPIAITPTGGMVLFEGSPGDLTSESLPTVQSGKGPVVFPGDVTDRAVVIDGERIAVDVAFPILHGPWGEDGTIQGLLELAGIPYVGSGVLASAVCMDKITMKSILRASGVAVSDWVAIDSREDVDQAVERAMELGPIVFVKPSRAGSSVGITRVDVADRGRSGIADAICVAREHDARVIVEQGVRDGREIECGVRSTAEAKVVASVCAEIVVRDGFDFYDFEAKYVSDGAELVVPADLPGDLSAHVRSLACECFSLIGCEGLARVDFFVTKDGILVNEVNTMPGFTPISMFPRMWDASGVSYSALVDGLVREAMSRPVGLR